MSDTYLDRLYTEYRRAAKAGQDVMDAAANENRELSPEDQETRDKAFADVSRLKAEIDKVRNFTELRNAADAFTATAAPIVERAGLPVTPVNTLRTVWTQGGSFDAPMTSAIQVSRQFNPEIDLRALQSAGGSAVETSFADFVTVYERTATPMLNPSLVRVINRTNGEPLVLPRVTADPAPGGTITAEAGGITELDPTISSVQLNPYKFALTNLYSRELADDNTIGLEDLLGFTTGRALGLNIGTSLTTDDGSAKPNGFINAAGNGGTASGTGATFGTYFGGTDLVTFFYSFAAPYRAVGAWQANNVTIGQIRNQRDTAGNFIWQPALDASSPERILGRPLYENPAMANGSAAKAVAFGDFQRYVVTRVLPIRVETSIHYKFSTDQVALRTIERVDGDLIDTSAVKYLVNVAV